MLRLREAGDTIVEVLISVAVLGLVIGFAYNLAVASSSNILASSQRTEALRIAQDQVEYLREYMQAGSTPPASFYCLYLQRGQLHALSAGAENKCDPFTPVDCSLYVVTTTEQYSSDSPDGVYQILVKWPACASNPNDNVTLYYEYNEN